jgi:regulatory protein
LKGSRADAKTHAIKLLSYRSRSKKEMLEKLQKKGFDGVEIENTIQFLEKTGLINDNVLVSDLFKLSVERKSLGKRGIRRFLIKRGIDKELIDNTLSSHTTESEEKAALEFAERKLKTLKSHPDNVIKRRLWGMLQRRGFSGDVITKVFDSIL